MALLRYIEIMLEMEFITPHTSGRFKNPNPISQIKVRPDVKFDFCFILSDDCSEDGTVIVSAEEKKKLQELMKSLEMSKKELARK